MTSTPTQRSRDMEHGRSASFSDMKHDIGNVKEDVSKLADDATRVARDGMEATWDQARKVADRVQEGHHKVCEYTSAHPTAALLIAVGVGAIIGRLVATRL